MAGRKAKRGKAKSKKMPKGVFLVIKPAKKTKPVKASCSKNPTKAATDALKFAKLNAQRATRAANRGECQKAVYLRDGATFEDGRGLAFLNCVPTKQKRALEKLSFSAMSAGLNADDAIAKRCVIASRGVLKGKTAKKAKRSKKRSR